MSSELSRIEVKEEGNLLIEAVSLLVQRQRESEGWIAEQIWQAEERATTAERRYTELEVRLASIEAHLAHLVQDLEPVRGDDRVEERLARLREQVEGLKSGGDARTAVRPFPVAVGPGAPDPPFLRNEDTSRGESSTRPERPSAALPRVAATAPAQASRVATAHGTTFWDLLGPSPQDRFGFFLIGFGLIAIVYAFWTRIG